MMESVHVAVLSAYRNMSWLFQCELYKVRLEDSSAHSLGGRNELTSL